MAWFSLLPAFVIMGMHDSNAGGRRKGSFFIACLRWKTGRKEGKASDEAVVERLKSTIIQVASFRTAEAAENARVTLLFLDLKARVIPPSQSDDGWHRLILGPFKTIRDMQATIDTLTKNGYNALERKE